MRIANPIYDVVFKFMMEDDAVARFILSTILGQEVVHLELLPPVKPWKSSDPITVFRLSCAVDVIREDGSQESILIRIKKAKFATDIPRFHSHLMAGYGCVIECDSRDELETASMAVTRIYFLVQPLEHVNAPVIVIGDTIRDGISGEELHGREPFFDCLAHNSHVIQFSRLLQQHRTSLETMLTIFDQHTRADSRRVLNVFEDDYPEVYKPFIHRLLRAYAEPKIMQTIEIEDEMFSELCWRDRKLCEMNLAIAKECQAIKEADRLIAVMDNAIKEKDMLIAKMDNALHP